MKKFAPLPRHAFDYHSHKSVAKKLNALLNGKITDSNGNVVGVIHYADGNTIWQIPPGGGVNLAITGEYDPNRTYSLNQVAIISMGSNAGTYVYINPSPSSGNAPYAGGGFWMQLPMGQLGVWL